MGLVRILLLCMTLMLALLLIVAPVQAGVLARADIALRFPAPLMVGEKDGALPVWPLFRQNATAIELAGYVFESADLAPVPGFSGVPPNLLVAIDAKGVFLDVAVLSHHEPVFLDGLGEAPMRQFVAQYKGVSLGRNIKIGSKAGSGADANHVLLDGVSKATASVRIMNQSVLAAALKVARGKLGFAQGRDPELIARVRDDLFEPLDLAQMLCAGLISHVKVRNRDAEQLFAGSAGAGLDDAALASPDATFIDLYLAYGSVPSIGRNLLDDKSWRKLRNRLEPGDHAFIVMSSGRYSVTGEDFVRGSVPERLVLKQDGLPLELRDLDLELKLKQPGAHGVDSVTAFRVIRQAGLDPSRALEWTLPLTRHKGIVYPERITRELPLTYRLPERYYEGAAPDEKSWTSVWQARRADIWLLGGGLAVLTAALSMQRRLTQHGRRFVWFRALYLAYTIGFIGYWAQGQLSVVNLSGAVQALLAGRNLSFFLFDPMTVLLWAFALVSVLLWGRGTFCGWLCPFGALQEVSGKAGQALGLPQIKLRSRADARLKRLKYAVLALIVVSAAVSAPLTDALVELEPFKTAITLNFVRAWPGVVYAVGLLLASAFIYKFFCRYLCPLGAALALLGRVRLLDWIPRRAECGQPCQTCRHRCGYQAIRPDGKIAYDECFQCMDCVVIYESADKCAPLMLEQKRARTITITRLAAQEGA
ncbi:MAG: 4Fe-4S binding protein [Pseudomonadota bacterium]